MPPLNKKPASDPFATSSPLALDSQIEQLQREVDNLRSQIDQLHQRDQTLDLYMHRLDEELRLAARVQQDFLPKTFPVVGSLKFHALYRPAGYVSGDLYDVCRLDEAHVGFSMADAVGHGMPAALLTMFIKNALVTKQITADGYRLMEPGQALSLLNNALVAQNLSQATFATAIYGTIHAGTLLCRYARAGHPSPILMRRDGESEKLESDGGLLGIFPEERYEEGSVQLRQGDRLFVYSDGLEVAFADDQTLDTRQWHGELVRRCKQPTDQLISELAEKLDHEIGSLRPKDDVTMIVIDVGY